LATLAQPDLAGDSSSPHAMFKKSDERFLIDVFLFTLATKAGGIEGPSRTVCPINM